MLALRGIFITLTMLALSVFSTALHFTPIAHNWDLLNEALDEFEQNNINVIEKGAEWADVTIRCYLLGSVISDVLDEMEENGDFDESEE